MEALYLGSRFVGQQGWLGLYVAHHKGRPLSGSSTYECTINRHGVSQPKCNLKLQATCGVQPEQVLRQ